MSSGGEKDPGKGLPLTQQVAETTAASSDVLTGLAMLHTAEAHAMLGNQVDCERALGEAHCRFERISATDSALELFSPTQQGRLAGSCYLFLNKPKLAEHILESTARELRDRSKSRAIVLGNLTLAYLRQGEVDAAVAMLHQAVDMIELTWGGGGLNIVFGACRELLPWRNVVAVQNVYDRVMTLMTV